jgi:hypothetical protein
LNKNKVLGYDELVPDRKHYPPVNNYMLEKNTRMTWAFNVPVTREALGLTRVVEGSTMTLLRPCLSVISDHRQETIRCRPGVNIGQVQGYPL